MKKRELRILSLLLSLLLMLSIFVGCAPDSADEDETKGAESTQAFTESETTEEEETTATPKKTFEEMSDTEKAFYLWNDSSILETKTSYQTDMTMSISGTMQEIPFTMTGSGTTKVIMSENEAFYYDSAEETIDVGDGMYVSEIVLERGYADGKFYSYQSEDGDDKGVYADVSKEDWVSFFKESLEDDDLILSSLLVKNTSFKETSDGYEIAFSGFTKQGLYEVESKLLGESSSAIIGKSPSDIELKTQFGKDMLPKKLTIEDVYEYAVGENRPELTMEATFSLYDGVRSSSVNVTGYRQVTNLLEAARIENYFGKLDAAKEASFDYAKQLIQTLDREILDDSIANYRVSCANKENGYTFLIDAEEGNDLLYSDGQLKQIQNGSTAQTVSLEEFQARSTIEGYYDPASFNMLDAESVTVTNSGISTRVEVTLAEVDLSSFGAIFDAYGFTIEELEWVEGTYVVELKNGKIVGVRYVVEFGLQYQNSGELSFECIQTVGNLTYTEA